jgi:hypothetical protein
MQTAGALADFAAAWGSVLMRLTQRAAELATAITVAERAYRGLDESLAQAAERTPAASAR